MEKRRRNSRSSIRRRYRNQKPSTKEVILNLLLKQLGVSIFLFLLVIIFQFIPLKVTTVFVQNINQMVAYNMSWDEALTTVKNTATYIPVVKDLIENGKNEENEADKDISNQIQEEENVPSMNIQDSSPEKEVLNQSDELDSDEIFILEPELGESEEVTGP